MDTDSQTLVNRLGWPHMSRPMFVLIVGCLSTGLLLLAAFADNRHAAVGAWQLWMMGLEPAVIVYTLGIFPLLHGRWESALEAIRPLAVAPELVLKARAVDRRGEYAALFLGAGFAVWADASQPAHGRWLALYLVVSSTIMFGLMALAIQEGLTRTRRLTRIVRGGLHLDLFDRHLLTPLARWGQSVSLTFLGGTCLSLLFQSFETLNTVQSLVIYSTMTAVSLALFFWSIWSIHVALSTAQKHELAVVRQRRVEARALLRQRLAEAPCPDAAGLYEPVVVLGQYEGQVLAASTWPFDPRIVREVVASLVAPVLIYGLKIALGLAATP